MFEGFFSLIIVLPLWVAFCIYTATYWSKKFLIRYETSLFYCLVFSPILGGIIVSFYRFRPIQEKVVNSAMENTLSKTVIITPNPSQTLPNNYNNELNKALINAAFVSMIESIDKTIFISNCKSRFSNINESELHFAYEGANALKLEIDANISIGHEIDLIKNKMSYQPITETIEKYIQSKKTTTKTKEELHSRENRKLMHGLFKGIRLNKRFKIVLSILLLLIFILWILNPSYTSFKEYASDYTINNRKIVYKKSFNGIVYSVYEKHFIIIDSYGITKHEGCERYKGFLMNFYKLPK